MTNNKCNSTSKILVTVNNLAANSWVHFLQETVDTTYWDVSQLVNE